MILRIIGASGAALRQIRGSAPAGVDVVDESVAEPDWILVATDQQRIDAIRSSGLAPIRVLQAPEIVNALDQPTLEAMRVMLTKIEGIGAWRPGISPVGVRLTAIAVRRVMNDLGLGRTAQPPVEAVPISTAVGNATRMPVGRRLDELLQERARERAKRFASHTVRLG